MALTTFGDIGTRAAAFAHANALAHAEPILVLEKFAQIRPMPKNSTETVKFRRPTPFAAVTTPLTEGATPSGAKMAYVDVTGVLAQYGDVHEITDVIQDLAEDAVLKDVTMLVGEQAAETKELLVWGVLVAGTNVFYDTQAHTLRSEVDSKFVAARQRAIIRSLKGQRAKKLTSILSGSVKVGTKPIQAAYVGFCHTDLENDIRDATGFIDVSEYGTRETLCPEEIGSIGEVRYISNPMLTNFADSGALVAATGMIATSTNVDVYPIVYVGKEAFGCVPLAGKDSIRINVLNPEKASKSDPLGQRGFVGFKMWFLSLILNENWMARLEVGATDL